MNELIDPVLSKSSEEKAQALITAMRNNLQTISPRLGHHFSDGVYARALEIPKGCCAVGKIHKYENMNILVKGRLLIYISDTEKIEVEAPYIKVSPPGTRRIVLALEDSIWVTIHNTKLTDPAEIEADVVTDSLEQFQEYITGQQTLQLESEN